MAEYTPNQFASALMASAAKTPRATVQVVRKGAANVKRDARSNVSMTAPVHNAHAQNAINFDVKAQGVTVDAEIGYDKGGPGNLGNLLEFGGGGDHSPPHNDLARALAAEATGFEGAVGDMGEAVMPP